MKETRTNIVLDDELVAKAMAKAGVRTKKAAIEQALRAYIREPDWKGLLALEGSRAVADDYDPAELFTDDPDLKLVAEPLAHYKLGRHAPSKSASKRVVKRRGK
ncbi:type II toxin-antitoxin system VapB family antitoxin [Piscinibacter sp.]|jgi:Arc/MetJ family transcription regulator|uniref:type II toxin-antitoxin system VapB family antitoxin n=1 Tax=Piscinibacter sp. TaxID=1903157 RepID=UPI002F3FFE00